MRRHPTTSHWQFPAADRPPLAGGARRVNLRELVARPERFEHHLTVVARVGDAQLEIATASEPLYFAHRNVSDEYAVAMATGDPLVDAMPMLTLISDFDTGADVARYKHRVHDLVLHPYGFLHWPGRLRPPYAPMAFAPGMRRCGWSLVACTSVPREPVERPLGASATRAGGPKRYGAADVPLAQFDLMSESERIVGRVGDAALSLRVEPDAFAPPRGGYAVVVDGEPPWCGGDLIYVPPGEAVAARGVRRALVFDSGGADAQPPPASWEAVPPEPFAPYEDAPPGSLPVDVDGVVCDSGPDGTVWVRAGGGAAARAPRYWLARMLYRIALHGYALGYVETYGGVYYDDRAGDHRIGVRGGGEVVVADVQRAVDRLYRAVAPPGYVERVA
ncbi:MAG: hypothetical protein D6689_16780 [Deltaproteobacteria bacterium]|nr:MAG: hypothetical protein D6689_16780 [Deltaproteobacteria bacterium]